MGEDARAPTGAVPEAVPKPLCCSALEYWARIATCARRLAVGMCRAPNLRAYQRVMAQRMARTDARFAWASPIVRALTGSAALAGGDGGGDDDDEMAPCCRLEPNALRAAPDAVTPRCCVCAAPAHFELVCWDATPTVTETLHACASHAVAVQCAWYLLVFPAFVYHSVRARLLSRVSVDPGDGRPATPARRVSPRTCAGARRAP